MGHSLKPRSICSKLILAFLLAVGPMMLIHLIGDISNARAVDNVSINSQRAVASAIARALARNIKKLKIDQRQMAAMLSLERVSPVELALANGGFVDSNGIKIIYVFSSGPQRYSSAGIGNTLVTSPDSSSYFRMTTPVTLADGTSGDLVYTIPMALIISSLGQEAELIDRGKTRKEVVASVVGGTPWQFIVSVQRTRAISGTTRLWFNILGMSLSLIIGLVIVMTLGRRIMSPIQRLAIATNAISVGDYRKQVYIKSGDEFEMLGESFNSLGENLISREATIREQADMLASMVEAVQIIASTLDVRKCGKEIAKVLCSHLGATAAAVYRKDRMNGGIKVAGRQGKTSGLAWSRLAQHTTDSGDYLVINESVSGRSLDPDAAEVLLVGIPFSTSSGTRGAMVARFEDDISREDLKIGGIRCDLLTAFGIHAAMAIENAELFQRSERYSELLEDWVEHLSSVVQVTDAVMPSLNLDETLNALARAAAQVVASEKSAILLPDRTGTLVARAAYGASLEEFAELRVQPGQSITGKAFLEKKCHSCPDIAEYMGDYRELLERLNVCSLIACPLVVEDRAIGVILVFDEGPRRFTARDTRLLTAIAMHVAMLVRNAGLYTREYAIAEALQKGLLPRVPETCMGVGFASKYIPALDEARIGGDFYQVTKLPNGKLGVVMADVSGKGLQAAIHLATCKYMMNALIFAYPNNPALVLKKLNDTINYYFDLSFFVTILYAVIDPENGEITFANAGHPPGLIVDDNCSLQTLLSATGIPVGAGYACDYESYTIQAKPSDVLLLYTDGVTEAIVDGKELGVDGLHQMIFECENNEAGRLIEFICARLNDEPSSRVKDDMALLAVSFGNIASELEGTNGSPIERESDVATGVI